MRSAVATNLNHRYGYHEENPTTNSGTITKTATTKKTRTKKTTTTTTTIVVAGFAVLAVWILFDLLQKEDKTALNDLVLKEDDVKDWPEIFGNAMQAPYSNYTPRLNVIWSRGWYNAIPEEPLVLPLTYYHTPGRSTEAKLSPDEAKYWTTLCRPRTLLGTNHHHHGYVWIRTKDLPRFSGFIQHINTKKQFCNISIISSDGDADVPSQITGSEILLESPLIHRWYAQNVAQQQKQQLASTSSKLVPIPLGLDLHSSDKPPLDVIRTMKRIPRVPLEQRPATILIDVGSKTICQRRNLIRTNLERTVTQCGLNVMTPGRTQEEAWQVYAQHAFGVAPTGCGWDTHRLWELLFLGTIPIVLSTELDPLLLQTHVPVMIVDSWSQVCTLAHNQTLMESMVKRYQHWIANARHWLHPSLWIPRDQRRFESLCDACEGCRQAEQVSHRPIIHS